MRWKLAGLRMSVIYHVDIAKGILVMNTIYPMISELYQNLSNDADCEGVDKLNHLLLKLVNFLIKSIRTT